MWPVLFVGLGMSDRRPPTVREVLDQLDRARTDLEKLYDEIQASREPFIQVGRRLLLDLMSSRLASLDEMIEELERATKDVLSASLTVEEA